ncbi:MAG: porphobilinogen synthase, partial [Candidatus Omnitrophica bacterium]|nr:porphobilinogen synthase [Candidatus Omnitrophota bacterium]
MEFVRLRRLRRNKLIRDLVSQVQVSVNDLIMPYFVIEGKNKKEEIKSMPGIFRLSIDNLIKDVKEVKNLGIKAVLLFGIPDKKDSRGTYAYAENGIVQRTIRSIRKEVKDIVVITDVCLCGYTSHGHCGILANSELLMANSKIRNKSYQLRIDNDETLKILAKIALSHAQAGVDFVAPSSMMDWQVKVIRETLDKNGFKETGILAYSAKYASNFYGPFREALNSAPQFGDRKSYQMDFR